MNAEDLKSRTKQLALRTLALSESLPKNNTTDIIGKQLSRAACSVAANYRAVCKARSRADFIHKLGIVEEEIDEVTFWLELLCDSGQATVRELEPLKKEAGELASIFAASRITAKKKPIDHHAQP
jgi:four helix bundle protein